jgi:hypothetical protein
MLEHLSSELPARRYLLLSIVNDHLLIRANMQLGHATD